MCIRDSAYAMDQGKAAGFVVRVERIDGLQQLIRRHRWADLQADRIADATEVFDVRAIQPVSYTHLDVYKRQALDFIDDDELVEITPKEIRLRKKQLTESDRKRASRSA